MLNARSEVSGAAPLAGKRRILMIAPAGQGGTLQYAHNLCDALVDDGHQVVLATGIDCEMAPFPRRYQLLGVFDRFRPRLGPLRRFAKLVRQMRPEIVHLQGAQRPEFYWLMLGILSKLCNARFVWTPQDVISNSDKPYYQRLQRSNYARMSHIFLNAEQNKAVVHDLFKVPAQRITVLPIPDLVAFARRDLERSVPPELNWAADDTPLILCFGLIEPRKGIAQLIEAFGQIGGETPARLLVMGKPLTDITPYQDALRGLKIPPDRAQIIARYASFEEMNWVFEAADIVVLPYISGWNSGVLASAFGFGKPVVATRVGGFDEVVQDGETGLLVAPDDASALTQALRRVLSDPALHKRLKHGAAKEGARTSWGELAAQTSDVYEAILSEGPDV
ncbi:glycosyltransferase family 4 protein [Profundibacter sp.]